MTLSGTSTYTGRTIAITTWRRSLSSAGGDQRHAGGGITINGSAAEFLQTSSVASTPAITLTHGTLIGTGAVGATTVGAGTGGIVANGNGAIGSTAALTLSSLTFNGAATANLNLAGGNSTTSPALIVSGALANSTGPVTLNVTPNNAWINGDTYDLIQYNSFTGSPGTLSNFQVGNAYLSPRQTPVLGISGSDITLTITGDSPKWTGLDSTNWQAGLVGTNDNWKLVTAGSPTNYVEGDVVLFDDSSSGAVSPGVVTLNNANVSPTFTTFNNSSISYTLSSTGGFGIAGSGPLIKNGTAAVVLATANSYTGPTTINAGTLNLQNNNALGATSSTTVASGAVLQIQGGVAIGNLPLTLNGAGLTASAAGALDNVSGTNSYAGLVTLGSAATIQSDAGTLSLTNAGTITGAGFGLTLAGAGNGSIAGVIGTGTGTLTKNGAGTWALSGVNTYSGTTIVTAGTLNISGGSTTLTAGSIVGNLDGASIELIISATPSGTIVTDTDATTGLQVATAAGSQGFIEMSSGTSTRT